MKNLLEKTGFIPFFMLFIYVPVTAQWDNSPDFPSFITDVASLQTQPVLVCDGEHGYHIFWIDNRDGSKALYGQRFKFYNLFFKP